MTAGRLGAWLRALRTGLSSLRPLVLADGSIQIGDDVYTRTGDVHSLQADGTWAPLTAHARGRQKGGKA